MLSLKNCESNAETGQISAAYELKGGKGSDLSAVVTLDITESGATARIDLGHHAADAEEAAFDKLVAQLEAAAKALKARGEPKLGVPVYG